MILINKKYKTNLTERLLKDRLYNKKKKGFEVLRTNTYRYKCSANLSIGTMVLKHGGAVDGINLIVDIDETENKTEVIIKSRPRIELILILLIWLILLILEISGIEDVSVLLVLLVFPSALLWFWMVYRFQENILLRKIIDYLNLELIIQKHLDA